MNETVVSLGQNVVNKLEALAAKLGITVEHLFTTVTQETINRSIAGVVAGSIIILSSLVGLLLFARLARKACTVKNLTYKNGEEYWPDNKICRFVIGMVGSIVATTISMVWISIVLNHIMTYFAPTTATLEQFAGFIK